VPADRRDALEALCRRVLALTRADAARVTVDASARGFTRYADNRITTAGSSADTTVGVTSIFGRRLATVATNRLDDAGLEEAVRRSEGLARLAPENPEYVGELGPQRYLAVPWPADGGPRPGAGASDATSSGDATDTMGAGRRAEAAAIALGEARAAGTVAAGFLDHQESRFALANTKGLFAYHAGAGAAHTLTMRTPDGAASGWAGGEASDARGVDHARIARAAVAKCLGGREPRQLEPGHYTVILEPTATGMLLLRLLEHLDARAADEGRSFFSKPGGGNRVGEALFDSRITIESDPALPGAEAAPFDQDDGLPRGPVRWIERGVLRALETSRYWARERAVEPLAPPGNLVLSMQGERGLEELIASTERGVLITRFWYIRPLNPRTMAYTGLTRDGTFLIEDGRIASAVNGFRFNQSLADLLRNVDAAGSPERVVATESSSVGRPVLAPPLRVREFHLASKSEAV
jgi:predicted Zn-dependent protease